MKEQPLGTVKSILIIVTTFLCVVIVILTSPILYLISRVINYIGTNTVRVRNGRVQTPVVTFEHPQTKRRVVFVGTMHSGLASYYRELQSIIETHSDSIVLYEGGPPGWSKRLEDLTPAEVEAIYWCRRDTIRKTYNALRMGLVYQQDGITYRDTWISNDLPPLETIRLELEYGLSPKDSMARIVKSRRLENMFLVNMPTIFYILPLIKYKIKKVRDRFHIAETVRNEVALKGIFAHSTDKDIVTIWGAKHIDGFGKGLRAAGFREIARTWHTCYVNQRFPFKEPSLRAITQDR